MEFHAYHLDTDVQKPEGWTEVFDEIKKDEKYNQLCTFLLEEQNLYRECVPIFPPKELIYNAFYLVNSPSNVKVVILGQDPYINHGQAMGLSFSVPDDCKIPPSLRNIYKNLQKTMGKEIPKTGNLTAWANQGVLLLNTALTVRFNASNSHQRQWSFFTDFVIQWISEHCENVVFMLWGNHAMKKTKYINPEKHLVLTGLHPSPLSHLGGGEHKFISLPHFVECNRYLEEKGKQPIMW